MFRTRALSFLVGLPVMLWICYAADWWLLGAVLLLAFIALREWSRSINLTPARPNYILSGLLIFLFIAAAFFVPRHQLDSLLVFLVALLVGLSFISRIILRGGPSPLTDIGATLLTPLYLGFFFSFLIRLRQENWTTPNLSLNGISLPPGFYFLVLLFFACWSMDTGAYLCGRIIGGPKLCPAVSPGKTIAGLVGAVVTAMVITAAGFAIFRLPLVYGAGLGVVMGVIGQLGDLSKSLIKREANIKDFGLVFPGHGGVLDRFDNILFNAPLLYYYLTIVLGLAGSV